MSMYDRFTNAAKKSTEAVDVELWLEQAVAVLDAHEGDQHVSAIEDLCTPKAVAALKEAGILVADKYYSKRQAACRIWALWRDS